MTMDGHGSIGMVNDGDGVLLLLGNNGFPVVVNILIPDHDSRDKLLNIATDGDIMMDEITNEVTNGQ